MSKRRIFLLSYVTSIIFILIGAFLRIQSYQGGIYLLAIGLIASLIYTLIGIFDCVGKKENSTLEKVVWTLAFFFFNMITGLVYYLTQFRK